MNQNVTMIEHKIGDYVMFLSDDNMLHISGRGNIGDEHLEELKKITGSLMESIHGKMKIKIDMNRSGKPSAKVREFYNELGRNDRIGKVALFGINPVARVLASFFLKTTNKKDLKFFSTEEEALLWLKE